MGVWEIFKLPPAHPDKNWFLFLDIWFSMNFWQLEVVYFYLDWSIELWIFALYSVILARPLEYFAELEPEEQAVSYATICSWISGWIQTLRQNNCTEHCLLNTPFFWFAVFWFFGVLGLACFGFGSRSPLFPGWFRVPGWSRVLGVVTSFDCCSFSWQAISRRS